MGARSRIRLLLVCTIALAVENVAFGAITLAKDNNINNCAPIGQHPPARTVRELRPDDIKVVMALGDSITAGAVMDGLFGGPFEFRGKSWAIGGDPKQITFPNFIKHYQPSVQGASRSYHVPEICLGDEFCPPGQYQPALDQLNAAQSGAWISNWPTEYQYLMEQMKANPKIDIQNDWKVLTILIGANNLCRACDPEFDIFDAADNFEDSLRQMVAKVQATIPKVFVNLVSIFNVSQVFDITEKSLECDAAHDILGYIECECIFPGSANATAMRAKADFVASQYRDRMRKVAASTPVTDTFALILQPMFSNMKVPDMSFISTFDCFHPSLYAHQQMGIALWNTMFLPAAQKPLQVTFPQNIFCPGNTTVFATA